MLAVLIVTTLVIFALISMASQETLSVISLRLAPYAIGAGSALVAQALLNAAKKSIFGEWNIEICIDGIVNKEESEKLSSTDAETLIEYDRPWWFVVLFDGKPSLRMNLAAEQLLRRCCDSLGTIKGNIKKYVTVYEIQRLIQIKLKRQHIRQYPE